jgi:hypothetical protein
MTIVARRDVLARWAYSEILGARASPCYNGLPGVAELRGRRENGVPFSALTATERDQLVSGWNIVRGAASLGIHLFGIDQFREKRLIKSQIAPLLVPTGVSGLAMMPFERFIETPPPPAADDPRADDPRNERRIYTNVSDDPITVGRCTDGNVLVDGYHRAVSFWRTAPDGSFILGYMPAD